jgi:hypothetical protein
MKPETAVTIRKAAGFIIAWAVMTAFLYPALRGLFSGYGEPIIFVFIGILLLIISRLLHRFYQDIPPMSPRSKCRPESRKRAQKPHIPCS